jgi:hypothetical protein
MTKDEALRLALEALQNPWKAGPDGVADAIIAVKAALEAKYESVGWFGYDSALCAWFETNEGDDDSIQLYKAPQRTWVGLTDEEIKAFDTWHDNREEEIGWVNPSEIVAYIEARLKEKNT